MRNKRKLDSLIESAIVEELNHNPKNKPSVVRLSAKALKLIEPNPRLRKSCVYIFISGLGFQIPIKETKRLFSRVEWKNGHASVFTSI